MKYQTSIRIEAPLDKVLAKFDAPELASEWQAGLQKNELLEGVAGELGAKSRLTFRMGKREMIMMEEITEKELPHKFTALYSTKGVRNYSRNRFVAINEHSCEWISEQEFIFAGFRKLIFPLMKGMFVKQSYKYQKDFKAFAEKG